MRSQALSTIYLPASIMQGPRQVDDRVPVLHRVLQRKVSSGDCGLILGSIQCRNTAFLIDYEFGEVEI